MEPGQRLEHRLDEGIAQAAGRPVFQFAEIEDMADDREMGIDVGTNVDVGAYVLHEPGSIVRTAYFLSGRLFSERLRFLYFYSAAGNQYMQFYIDQANRFFPARTVH